MQALHPAVIIAFVAAQSLHSHRLRLLAGVPISTPTECFIGSQASCSTWIPAANSRLHRISFRLLLPCIAMQILDLPDELIRLIARQVLESEDGMWLWCSLASTCRRFWSFQLPSEPTHFLDNGEMSPGDPLCCHDVAGHNGQAVLSSLLAGNNKVFSLSHPWRCRSAVGINKTA